MEETVVVLHAMGISSGEMNCWQYVDLAENARLSANTDSIGLFQTVDD